VPLIKKLGFPAWQAGGWGDVGKPDAMSGHYEDTDKIGGSVIEMIHAY
jgi:hypothetical protein